MVKVSCVSVVQITNKKHKINKDNMNVDSVARLEVRGPEISLFDKVCIPGRTHLIQAHMSK